MTSNSSNNTACNAQYLAQISQRTQLAQFQGVVPPVRLEVGENPYASGRWTTSQLAMRRKFDILQYPGTAGAATRGGATATQHYVRLLRGGSVIARRVAPQSNVDARYSVCDVGNPISVSRSNVPCGGDTDVLFLDLDAPRHMYLDPRLDRNYTEFADLPADPFAVYYSAQMPVTTVAASPSATWATIRLSTASRPARRFLLDLSVPLAVVVAGTRTTALATTTTILVGPHTMHLYYNDTSVANYSPQTPPLSLTLAVSAGQIGTTFSAAVFVETMNAQLSVFSAADAIAVFTARVNARLPAPPTGVTNLAVVAHIDADSLQDYNSGGATLGPTTTPTPPPTTPSLTPSSVVWIEEE